MGKKQLENGPSRSLCSRRPFCHPDFYAIANTKLPLTVLKRVQSMRCHISRRNSADFGELLRPVYPF